MRKLFFALIAGVAALSASAQVNYKIQTACNPQDVKTYDTERLRSSFLMEKVMVPDQINVTYSMYDRFIFGGAVPVTKDWCSRRSIRSKRLTSFLRVSWA